MKHWSTERTTQLTEAIERCTRNNPHPFAVFDADNTIWKHDLVESLLGWLSQKGLLHLCDTPSEILPVQPSEMDTIISYYDDLCAIDHALGYLFASQIFAGFTLRQLQREIDLMMASSTLIEAPMPNGTKTLQIPALFPGQIELIHWLQANGIDVWIVSASLEELVRMVASNPIYGLNLPPERVIGVNLMFARPDGTTSVGALERRSGCQGNDYYFAKERMQSVLTTVPFSPLTWYGGKVAAILEWIDEAHRPILVAGDSPNDFYMQFHADDEGIRLRIDTNPEHKVLLEERIRQHEAGSMYTSPRCGWMEVNATMLGIPE